ncbi:MAG: protease SohB [Bdellovibrionaceae bacterium]|nr:protease SohB [Pseudobdellovibrionaceae bacterium]
MEKLKSSLLWMLESLSDIAEFGFKALIVVISFALCVLIVKKLRSSEKSNKKKLKVENLKKQYEKYSQEFYQKTMDKKEFKNYLKDSPNKKKSRENKDKKSDIKNETKKLPSLFVLSFEGDIMASEVNNLREEVSIILNIAKPKDEVAVLLESRGGSVPHYGLAANQLQRLRENNIPLTICVDKVAGSGGYLMACVGNQVLASPFAFIGSIGVLMGLPNIHEFLKKHNISYEEFTAGKYKRTVTPLGQITEEKRQKLQEQLELVHQQFKNFVQKYRKQIDLEEVATGETWLAETALQKSLVDKLQCSDDYILEKIKTHNVYKISLTHSQSFLEKLMNKKPILKQSLEEFFQKDLFF